MPNWIYAADHPEVIAAEAIEQAVRSNEPIGIGYAIVEGDLSLSAIDYSHRLRIRNTRFTGNVDFRDARFSKSVDLTTCTFEKGITLNGAKIDGHLRLFDSTVRADDTRRHADLRQLRVSCDLIATGIQSDVPFIASGAQINGGVDFSSTATRQTIFGNELNLAQAHIGGQLGLAGVRVDRRLNLQGATIDADLLLHPKGTHRSTIHDAWLPSMKVKGTLNLSGISIIGNLNLQYAMVDGPSLFRVNGDYRSQIGGLLQGTHATFKGMLDLEAVTISRAWT